MSTIQLIADDADPDALDYTGQWVHETGQVETYGGTLSVCRASSTTTGSSSVPPSLFINSAGADVFIYGTMTKGLAGTYSIDFGPSQTMVFSNSTVGKPGVELWRLTGLLSAYSFLEIKPTAGDLTIDYVAYTPTSLTILDGSNLIIDDQDPALEYSKGWVGTTKEQYPQAVPYLGTTTSTNTVGSSMELNFNGELVAVYGALQQVPGILSVSFSVDNAKPTLYTPWNGTQTNTSDWFIAWKMFQMSVSEGPHTLRVSLQQATGSQMLWLDSVIVQAGFTTTLSNVASASGSESSVGTTGVGGISPIPTLTTPSFNTNTSSGFRLSGRAIVGLAVGLLVLVIIVLGLLRRYLTRCLAGRKKPAPDLEPMAQVPVTPTTPLYTPPPLVPPPSPPAPTTPSGQSLHNTLNTVLNQQHGAQTLPLPDETHWDLDVSSGPTQPSHQGSTSNLRNRDHYTGQPEV